MKRRFGLLFDAYLHSIFVAGVVIDVLFCTFILIDTSNNKAPLFSLLLVRLLLLVACFCALPLSTAQWNQNG